MPRLGLVPVLLLLALWGCASALPAPPQQRVVLKTSISTRHYPVRGMTTAAIFDHIDRNGLFEKGGQRVNGLTSAEWTMTSGGIDTRAILCSHPSMTITLDLVVTLPRHDESNDLSEGLRTTWQRFVTRVAAHEQRHVDIFLDGAKAMKARMEAVLTKWSSCSELGKTIHSLWTSQLAEIENAQQQFDVEDGAKIQNDREPLQARIDVNRARLAALDSEIRRLDLTRDELRLQLDAMRARIDAVKVEITKAAGSLPRCAQARPTSRVQALCHQHHGFVAANNTLVEQYNGVTDHRNNLADEYNRLTAATNGLIEVLNWTK